MLRLSKGMLSLDDGYLNNRYFNSVDYNVDTSGKERYKNKLLRLALIVDRNTLNHTIYPYYGSRFFFKGAFLTGKNSWKLMSTPFEAKSFQNNWLQILLDYEKYFNISKHFKLGTRYQGSLSTRANDINYLTSLTVAPGFSPTPHSKTVFNSEFHEPKYFAAGLMPIIKFSNALYIKSENYCFLPIYKIYNDKNHEIKHKDFFSTASVISETTLVYNLPFTTVGLFANYSSNKKLGWSIGLNVGYLIRLPSFY